MAFAIRFAANNFSLRVYLKTINLAADAAFIDLIKSFKYICTKNGETEGDPAVFALSNSSLQLLPLLSQ